MFATAFLHVVSLLLASSVNGRHPSVQKYTSGDNKDYDAALQFLWENNEKQLAVINKMTKVQWNYASNLTEENKKNMVRYLNL